MRKGVFHVKENMEIAPRVYEMTLSGDCSGIVKPGQFVNIAVPGFYLRRPISVCDREGDTLRIIYKAVGGGTERMSGLSPGFALDILSGLGNGFDPAPSGDFPLLIGGGAGAAPMYGLAKELIKEGKSPCVILGFNTREEVFYEREFIELLDGILRRSNDGRGRVKVTTVDGSHGVRGFVTDAMPGINYSHFYACGPEPMLRAVYDASLTDGQLSFEERMGCGFGACMGCSCETKYGALRICRDGPVLSKEEVIW